jgi:hypothetical protein
MPIYSRKNFPRKEKEDVFGGPGAWDNAQKGRVQCPTADCNGDEAAFFQVQIRSADEPMTTFYKVGSLLGPGYCLVRGWLLTDAVHDVRASVEGELREDGGVVQAVDWLRGISQALQGVLGFGNLVCYFFPLSTENMHISVHQPAKAHFCPGLLDGGSLLLILPIRATRLLADWHLSVFCLDLAESTCSLSRMEDSFRGSASSNTWLGRLIVRSSLWTGFPLSPRDATPPPSSFPPQSGPARDPG